MKTKFIERLLCMFYYFISKINDYENLSDDELQEKLDSGIPYTVRLKVPEGQKVRFKDTVICKK